MHCAADAGAADVEDCCAPGSEGVCAADCAADVTNGDADECCGSCPAGDGGCCAGAVNGTCASDCAAVVADGDADECCGSCPAGDDGCCAGAGDGTCASDCAAVVADGSAGTCGGSCAAGALSGNVEADASDGLFFLLHSCTAASPEALELQSLLSECADQRPNGLFDVSAKFVVCISCCGVDVSSVFCTARPCKLQG